MKRFLLPFWEVFEVIIISFVSITLIYKFVAQPFIVKGASMEPTFENNDFLLVDEFVYRFREPSRGEVIVFRNPRNEEEFYIKRIVGLPGEEVTIREGAVFVDGKMLEEEYVPEEMRSMPGDHRFELAENEYFVMGDNRLESSDSRSWGPLDEREIIGIVRVRFWPVEKLDLFKT